MFLVVVVVVGGVEQMFGIGVSGGRASREAESVKGDVRSALLLAWCNFCGGSRR